MTKSVEILVEELKKNELIAGEIVLAKAYASLKSAATRMTVEADEAVVKSMAPVLVIVLTALEAEFKSLIDLNKDGKIGE